MKKILLILLLVLTLCSCGVSEEPVPEEPQSEPEISGSSASEPEEPEKAPEKTEDEIYYESLDREGKNMYSHINRKEINYNTFESRLHPGLFITGELLDVDGKSGGLNLHFAWASGYTAAQAIKEK